MTKKYGSSTNPEGGNDGAAFRRSRPPFKLAFVLFTFAGVYYYVGTQEKASMMRFRASVDSVTLGPTLLGNGDGSSVFSKSLPRRSDDIASTITTKFILNPENEFTPAIAWLMSFPNSGTSYTMTMVEESSTKAFATNYCDEVMARTDKESLSIYPRRPEGPFWAGKSGKIATPRDLPDKYVLTKTHCGSRCLNCGPNEYVETPEYFLRRCASGHARVPPKRRRVEVEYPPERVAKAIHLIRNPYHNIIARYHLARKNQEYKNRTEWLEKYSNDKEGLQRYCHDFDDLYAKEDEAFFGVDKVPKAPCHGEFFKWTQWHNLVHEGLALIKDHRVPVLTVYYEDYSTNFNATVARILEFLELEHLGFLKEFSPRSDYEVYFTDEQENDVRDLIKSVASEKTWSQIKHYFK